MWRYILEYSRKCKVISLQTYFFSDDLHTPMSSKMFVEKLRFLSQTLQDFSPYTGTSKKIEYREKGQYFFVTHFRKWNPYII